MGRHFREKAMVISLVATARDLLFDIGTDTETEAVPVLVTANPLRAGG